MILKGEIVKVLRSQSARTLEIFAGGSLLAAGISGISGLIYAQWISPEVLGEFSKYGILTGYLGFGLIVVHGALPRQYPYLIGKGEKEEALNIAGAAKWWYLLFSWIGTIVFCGLVIDSISNKNYRAAIGWGVQIPALWMAIYGAFLQTIYRSSSDFRKLSYIQVFTSSAAFILLVIVKLWNYWGFVLRFAFQGFINLLTHQRYIPEQIKSSFDWKRLKELAKISIPLSVPSYIDTYLLQSTISFLILHYLGERDLGIYGMAFMFQGMFMIFTRAIHQIYITKLTIKFGETESVSKCLTYAKMPTIISIALSTLIALGVTLLIGPIIKILIPNYVDSITLLKVIVWQLPLFASGLALIVLTSALWYKEMIILRLIKTITTIALILILPKAVVFIGLSIIISDLIFYLGGYAVLFYKLQLIKSTI